MALLRQIFATVIAASGRRPMLPAWPVMAVAACAVPLTVLAVGFLAVSLFLFLGETLSPPMAALIVAASLFLLAATLIVTAVLLHRSQPRSPAEPFADSIKLIDALLPTGQTPSLSVIALLVGLALGYSPSLRGILRKLIK